MRSQLPLPVCVYVFVCVHVCMYVHITPDSGIGRWVCSFRAWPS